MNPPHPSKDEIFERALLLTSEARAAYLKEAAGGDEQLRQRIEALLQANESAGAAFLNEPAVVSAKTLVITTAMFPVTEKPGDKIGRYKLREQIGEGGCGVVYVAEQEEPVRRLVALKVIKLGMDTKQVVARFEAERQALALMDHPNIAKVLDGGATDTGRPYFVMELVRGIKITDYCDKNGLSTEERLKLFILVCSAIQHAHQKGIIHRDIKPSNVLVTLHDGVPVPKVIDFGIAKATTAQRLTDKTIYTAFEQFIGTPAYMSPEQAEMSGLDIDTRSDIYSLGVLLYELLTGRTPFDTASLLQAGFDRMRQIIREQEPQRPSTRLSTLELADLTTAAKHRSAEPPKLLKLIRGDLDWIAMKSLDKDRTRRYETANGFAQDIKRHLMNEPVSAGPPSAGYRFGKFVKRKKVFLGMAIALAVLTTALLASIYILLMEFRVGGLGGISVRSNPQGAEVWHNGERIGTTPFEKGSIPPGEFTYSLVLKDYETVTNTTILVAKKQMNDLTLLREVKVHDVSALLGSNSNTLFPNASNLSAMGTVEISRSGPNGWLPTQTNTLPPDASSLSAMGTAEISRSGTNGWLPPQTNILRPNASILSPAGTVEINRGGTNGWLPARTKMLLYAGDLLRTGNKSRVSLRFSDLNTVRVNANTWMIIQPHGTNQIEKLSLNLPSFVGPGKAPLVIASLGDKLSQVVAPFVSAKLDKVQLLDQIKSLEKSDSAFVILNNYHEAQLGHEFRDRTFPFFRGLRELGYKQIVFVSGYGIPAPDGLSVLADSYTLLAEYD